MDEQRHDNEGERPESANDESAPLDRLVICQSSHLLKAKASYGADDGGEDCFFWINEALSTTMMSQAQHPMLQAGLGVRNLRPNNDVHREFFAFGEAIRGSALVLACDDQDREDIEAELSERRKQERPLPEGGSNELGAMVAEMVHDLREYRAMFDAERGR